MIAQIAVIDIVFPLDPVITAVGLVNLLPVMVAAIGVAVAVMILAADPVGEFIDEHPTIRTLALSFLILVGMALIADGLGFDSPRSHPYVVMALSVGVKASNMAARASPEPRFNAG